MYANWADQIPLGFLIEQRVHVFVINQTMEPRMNTKPTALDAYLARTAAIHSKLERLQQLADDHFGHDPDAIHWGHVAKSVPAGDHRISHYPRNPATAGTSRA